MHKEKYTLLVEDDSFHEGAVALLDREKILCVLENERVSKHKHAVFEHDVNETIDYIKRVYNIKDEDLHVTRSVNVPYLSHHELHAAASYFSSGFDKASILVVDNCGDRNDCTTLFAGRGKEIYELKKYERKYSLGLLYDVVASYMYDSPHSEGKMMGLSCCSEPEYNIPSPIQYHEDGTIDYLVEEREGFNPEENLLHYVKEKFSYLIKEDGKVLEPDIYKAKIAATVQWWFTEQVVNLVKYLKSLNPKSENLCVCGGCFLNCETNGIIDRLGLFKNIYCIPAPADNSTVLGRAQQLLMTFGNEPQVVRSPYLGPTKEISDEELINVFRIYKDENNNYKSKIYCLHDIQDYSEDWVIERLKNNRPILWFEGGSEFGPRALGHRSFLANPASNDMFWKLSVGIKSRENYRPLAPITTDNLYPLMFEDPNPENLTAFMLKTVRIKPEWHSKIRAVTHVNQTARPQRLTEDVNPVLHSLINKWYKETGLPCLINTSLNLKNQPLLETYNDLKSVFVCKNVFKYCSVVVDHKLCFDLDM